MLDDGIRTLANFHKDSVTSYKEIKKDCDKKDFLFLFFFPSFIKIFRRRVSGMSLPNIKSCLILINSFLFTIL